MLTELVIWSGWIATIVVYLTLVYWAWRALFADRSRGRRRCPRCWFDMQYSPGMTCSECGHTARTEHAFYRTRRNYKQAILAIFACVAIVLAGNMWVTDRGWLALLPDKALILSLPLSDSGTSRLRNELTSRMRADKLSEYEWSMLLNRIVKGHAGSRPPSDGWANRYGQMLDLWRPAMALQRPERGIVTEHEQRLYDLPADVDFRSRRSWPVDASPMIHLTMREWWPMNTDVRLHVVPKLDGMAPITIYRNSERPPWSGYPIELNELPSAVSHVEFDVRVDRRGPLDGDDWMEGELRTHRVEIRRTGQVADALEAVEDEALTEAIAATFRNGVVKWTSGEVPVRVYWTPGATYSAAFNDIAIGVHVDILRDGLLARRLDIWWLAGDLDDHQVGYMSDELDESALQDVNMADGRWTLRITGNPALALRAGDPDKYWKGRVTMPIRVNQIDQAAPRPRWWTDEG